MLSTEAKEKARKRWMAMFDNVYPRCESIFRYGSEITIVNRETLETYGEDGKKYTLQVAPWESEEEIQIGDEVEHNIKKRKSVVLSVDNEYLYILRCESDYIATGTWLKENCTRTGKTYPELIKALEELPKEEA